MNKKVKITITKNTVINGIGRVEVDDEVDVDPSVARLLKGMNKCEMSEDVKTTSSPLDDMTVKELIAFADERDIDLGKAKKKADIIELITAAEADEDEN